ncbi:MAG TPA: F0F1 ATP synthase subunit epsilon [Actinomycetota bacterium]|jgi:F-type H+-transporting ATPase subunit epsilon|nr:F0F1 ATP synthase subunit epsilon [Actinomycetota bacterium]
MPLQVSVVTPEREVWSGEANFVVARSEGGEVGVLPGLAPFLGALRHSTLKIEPSEGGEIYLAAHGGFIEVFEDRVTVLTPVAEIGNEIDVGRAQSAKERAEAALRQEETPEQIESYRRAEARMRAAAAAGGGTLYD